MNKTKRLLLSSVLTIAFCLSLIAGSTFALFTSKVDVNIAVTSGKVNLEAQLAIISYEEQYWDSATGTYKTYKGYTNTTGGKTSGSTTFSKNGGAILWDRTEGTVELQNIAPGTKVMIPLAITNKSSINSQYRVEVVSSGELNDILSVTGYAPENASLGMNGVTYKFRPIELTQKGDIFVTEWTKLNIPTNTETGEPFAIGVEVEFPLSAGNEYADKSAKIAISVVATQQTANTSCDLFGNRDHFYGEDNICVYCGNKSPFSAHHEETADSYTITGIDEGVKELVIPEKINGKAVKVDESFTLENNSEIEKLVIEKGSEENGLQTLRNKMFEGCTALKEVVIGEGVTSVGEVSGSTDGVFTGCTSLKTVSLPSTVTTIGTCAFYNCKALENINLPEGLTTVEGMAFCNCSALKSITLPESLVTINQNGFGSTNIQEVTIPKNVETIGDRAFAYNSSLKKVTFKGGKILGPQAFFDCKYLEQIIFEADCNVERICDAVFAVSHTSQPNTLKEVVLPNSLKYFGGNKSSDTSGNRPSGVFAKRTNLERIVFQSKPEKIFTAADNNTDDQFSSCTGLKYVCFTQTEDRWPDFKTSFGTSLPEGLEFVYNYEIA